MKETVEIRIIQPEEAKADLQKHEEAIAKGEIRNRKLRMADVRKYTNDMRRKHWGLGDQAITYDYETGHLLNGRHRLWACVKSGIPMRAIILHTSGSFKNNGTVIPTIDMIDQGRPRLVPQQLHIDGIKYATQQAAAMRVIAMMLTNQRDVKLSMSSARELLGYYTKAERVVARFFCNIQRSLLNGNGSIVGPLLILQKIYPETAEKFMETVVGELELGKGNPVIALQLYRKTHSNIGQDGVTRAMNATALALKHFHQGTKVGVIRISEIGADWLRDEAKAQVRRVKEIVGDQSDEVVEGPVAVTANE